MTGVFPFSAVITKIHIFLEDAPSHLQWRSGYRKLTCTWPPTIAVGARHIALEMICGSNAACYFPPSLHGGRARKAYLVILLRLVWSSIGQLPSKKPNHPHSLRRTVTFLSSEMTGTPFDIFSFTPNGELPVGLIALAELYAYLTFSLLLGIPRLTVWDQRLDTRKSAGTNRSWYYVSVPRLLQPFALWPKVNIKSSRPSNNSAGNDRCLEHVIETQHSTHGTKHDCFCQTFATKVFFRLKILCTSLVV